MVNRLGQIYEKLSLACPCGFNDYRAEIRTETIVTLNVPASNGEHLDTVRTTDATITISCNRCGKQWRPG